jgi:hypothetical protein
MLVMPDLAKAIVLGTQRGFSPALRSCEDQLVATKRSSVSLALILTIEMQNGERTPPQAMQANARYLALRPMLTSKTTRNGITDDRARRSLRAPLRTLFM